MTVGTRQSPQMSPFQSQYRTIADDLWLNALIISIGILIYAFGAGITTSAQHLWQSRLDRIAKTAVKTGDFKRYALYLRPFEVDGATLPQPNRFDLYEYFGTSSLIRSITEALDRTCPLVGLGDRGNNPFGFGNAGYLENDWEKRAKRAIETSKLIILLPGPSSGVLWEIGQILEAKCMHKTVFVMPPNSEIAVSTNFQIKKFWENTTYEIKQKYDIDIPEYTDSGGLFVFHEMTCRFSTFDRKMLHDGYYMAGVIDIVLHGE